MRLKHVQCIVGAVLTVSVLAACTFTIENPNSPANVVRRMYDASASNDMNAYLDTLVPEARSQPQINLQSLFGSMSLSAMGIGIGLGDAVKFHFSQTDAQVLEQQDSTALVQIRGNFRLTGIVVMEVPFCGEHETRLVDGKWLVDVVSPTQAERVQRIAAMRQQEMNDLSANASPPLQLIDRRMFIIMLNQCERPSKAIA